MTATTGDRRRRGRAGTSPGRERTAAPHPRAALRLTLLGVGAMNSPRYRPAGLLLGWRGHRVMFDGGDGAVPSARVDAWLLTDARAELGPDIRRRGRALGIEPEVGGWQGAGLRVRAHPVAHTSHPAYGYLVDVGGRRVVWAPEFWQFPAWAAGADLMFADAAGWRRPIRFAGGVGGHACVWDTADRARAHGVRRLVFAHIGRPSIRALDAGERPPFGEWGVEGRLYRLAAWRAGPFLDQLPTDVWSPTPAGDTWSGDVAPP